MSNTLDKKELLDTLDRLATAYDLRDDAVASAFKSLIIRIERGQFDTKESGE